MHLVDLQVPEVIGIDGRDASESSRDVVAKEGEMNGSKIQFILRNDVIGITDQFLPIQQSATIRNNPLLILLYPSW